MCASASWHNATYIQVAPAPLIEEILLLALHHHDRLLEVMEDCCTCISQQRRSSQTVRLDQPYVHTSASAGCLLVRASIQALLLHLDCTMHDHVPVWCVLCQQHAVVPVPHLD